MFDLGGTSTPTQFDSGRDDITGCDVGSGPTSFNNKPSPDTTGGDTRDDDWDVTNTFEVEPEDRNSDTTDGEVYETTVGCNKTICDSGEPCRQDNVSIGTLSGIVTTCDGAV